MQNKKKHSRLQDSRTPGLLHGAHRVLPTLSECSLTAFCIANPFVKKNMRFQDSRTLGRRPFIRPGVAAARAERQRSEYGAPSALRGHGDSRACRHPWLQFAARQIRSAAMAAHRCPQPPRAGLRAWRACALRPWRAGPAKPVALRSAAEGDTSGVGTAAEGAQRGGRADRGGWGFGRAQRVLCGTWRSGKTWVGCLPLIRWCKSWRYEAK